MSKFSLLTTLSLDSSQYEKQISNVKNKNGGLGASFGGVAKLIGGLGLAFSASAIASKTFVGAMNATDANADKLAITQGRLNASIESFYRTIATGDWSHLLTNLKQSADSAEAFITAMDKLENLNLSLSVQEQQKKFEIEDLRDQLNNVNIATEKRIKIGYQLLSLEEELANKRKKYSKEELDVTLERISEQTKIAKIDLINFTKNYEQFDKQIKKGQEYNDILNEIEKTKDFQNAALSNPSNGSAYLKTLEIYDKKLIELNEKLSSIADGEHLGKMAKQFGTASMAQLQEIADAMKKNYGAEASYLENTRKTNTKIHTLEKEILTKKQKQNAEIQKQNDLLKQQKDLQKQKDLNTGLTTIAPKSGVIDGITDQDYSLKVKIDYNFDESKIVLDNWLEEQQQAIDGTYDILSTSASAYSNFYEAQKNRELQAAQGNETKKAEINQRYFEKQKRIDTAQAFINTALSITKSLASYAWPYNLIPAAASGAEGFAQVANIQNQRFTDGGIVKGRGYNNVGDHVPILANPGEVILNQSQQGQLFRMFNNKETYGNNIGEVKFKIEGYNLVGILEKTNRKKLSYS